MTCATIKTSEITRCIVSLTKSLEYVVFRHHFAPVWWRASKVCRRACNIPSQSVRVSWSYFWKMDFTPLQYERRRGGCLDLYYCNMVEWCWWDSSLISTTNWFPSVLWHCWFGHLPVKIIPEMTYYVSSGTLNPTHSLTPTAICAKEYASAHNKVQT